MMYVGLWRVFVIGCVLWYMISGICCNCDYVGVGCGICFDSVFVGGFGVFVFGVCVDYDCCSVFFNVSGVDFVIDVGV